MNALKNLFSQFRSKIPQGGAGGAGGAGGEPGGAAIAFLSRTIVAVGFLGGLGYTVNHSIVTVQPGHKGIVYNRITGLNEKATLREGINFVIPWFERPVIYDMRTRPQLIQTQTGSKDLQIVQISLRVLFKPDPENLPFMYRRLGRDYDERVLPSIVNEVAKAVVAQYNASELLTKREVVSAQIRHRLLERSADFKILLDDVSITHLAFSKEYTAAVEAKQVAQQDAERSKYIVEKAIQEKRSIIIRAEGEARSAELIGHAIRDNPAFIQLRRIEAARDVALTVASSANRVYLDSSTLLLNHLGDVTEEKEASRDAAVAQAVQVSDDKKAASKAWF